MRTKKQISNRILSLVLALVMVMGMVSMTTLTVFAEDTATSKPYSGTPASSFDKGNGTLASPYEIDTAEELYYFASLVNGDNRSIHAKLTADIVVNENVLNSDGTLNGTPNHTWTPIGDNSNEYTGSFDGNGHTVSGLYFNDTELWSSATNGGLFGYVDSGGKVQNVGIVDSYFYSRKGAVGGIVGYNSGTITNCYNTGAVNGSSNIGGSNIGGIVGENYGTITNCYNTGAVNGNSNVGGVVGINNRDIFNKGTITNCYNTGAVNGNYYVGGVAGRNNSATITNCYYLTGCAADGDGTTQFGIGAFIAGRTTKDEEGCTTGKTETEFASGEVAYLLGDAWGQNLDNGKTPDAAPAFTGDTVYKVTNCLEQIEYSNTNESGHKWENGICIVCGDYQSATLVTMDNYSSLGLTEDYIDYYAISNVGQLIWYGKNNGGSNAVLVSDIQIGTSETPWVEWGSVEIGSIFDGNGHTVDMHLTYRSVGGEADSRAVGLLSASGKTVRNLILTGSITCNSSYRVGAVSHSGYGSVFENIISYVDITNQSNAPTGGIVGYYGNDGSGSTMTNCAVYANISGGNYVGGLVGQGWSGWQYWTLTNCAFYGNVTGAEGNTGALVGYSSTTNGASKVTINNCYYPDTLSAVGGFASTIGTNDSYGKTEDQFTSGEVTYLLNGSKSDDNVVWKQTLTGEDKQDYPQFTGSIVYYDNKNDYYSNHMHSWKYEKDGDNKKITATCTAGGCTNENGGSVTISAPTDLTYDGNSKDATLFYDESWALDELTITYDSTNRVNVTGNDITASVTLGGVTVTVTYQVEAASISGATVTVNGNFVYNGSAIEPTDITVQLGEKTLKVGTDYTVSYSDNTMAGKATVTITGKGNYTGTTTGNFVIVDETKPDVDILVEDNTIRKILNTLTFGLFCKDYVDVTVTAEGTGSSVAKIEYLFSAELLDETTLPTEGWQEVKNSTINVTPQNKGIIYVRVTDEGENVMVINSDGIVVYEDSKAYTTNVEYTYAENSDQDVLVTFNGNTVKSIACGSSTLTAGTDYTMDYTNGKIVLKADYLNTLNAGDYTFTVSYDPMGVADSSVSDLANTSFTVKVDKAEIGNVAVDVTAPEVGAAKQTAVTGGAGYSAAISWDCDTEKFGYNTAYTATVMLTADGNHKFASGLTVDGWKVESNTDSVVTLSKTFAATRKEKLTAISAPTNTTLSKYYTDVADAIKELPTTVTYTTESGSVTVNIEWACNNYDNAVTKTNTFTWTVKNGELDNYDVNGIATTGEITVNKPADTTSPNTGDTSNMFLWIALLFISGGAVITLTVVDRKKRMASKR